MHIYHIFRIQALLIRVRPGHAQAVIQENCSLAAVDCSINWSRAFSSLNKEKLSSGKSSFQGIQSQRTFPLGKENRKT